MSDVKSLEEKEPAVFFSLHNNDPKSIKEKLLEKSSESEQKSSIDNEKSGVKGSRKGNNSKSK